MTSGMHEYVPMAMRKMAPYCRGRLSVTAMRMALPVRAKAREKKMNGDRSWMRSERKARRTASTQAAAEGGTECSCVSIRP